MGDFFTTGFVELFHFLHVFGQQIHVFHSEDRKFQSDHFSYFTGPQPSGVDNMFRMDVSLVGVNMPGAVFVLVQGFNSGLLINFTALFLGGFGIGPGCSRGIEMPFDGIVDSTDEVFRVHERHDLRGFLCTDDFGFHTEVSTFCMEALQPVEAILGAGKHHSSGEM